MAGKSKAPKPGTDGWRLHEELAAAFTEADRSLRRLRGRDSQLPPGHIGHSRFELMFLLRDLQPCSMNDLAKAAGFSAPSISRMLEALEADGFVFRVRSESDRRLVMVALTDLGRELVDARGKFWGDRWLEALEDVDLAEIADATEVLRRIADVFGDPDVPVPQADAIKAPAAKKKKK